MLILCWRALAGALADKQRVAQGAEGKRGESNTKATLGSFEISCRRGVPAGFVGAGMTFELRLLDVAPLSVSIAPLAASI